MASTIAELTSEVPESEASGPVKRTYDEIKQTLRTPVVSPVFRVLATNSDFLQLAWRQLHPNMQTTYIEMRADGIRRTAAETVSALGQAPTSGNDEVTAALKTLHYVIPKVFLAVSALRSAVNGQYPKLSEIPAAEKRQIASGIPEGAPSIQAVNRELLSDPVRSRLDDIQTTLGLEPASDEFRILAAWPDYLETAWNALGPVMAAPGYVALTRELRRQAEEAILTLPFRVEINPHIMRLCGLDEREIDQIRATLNAYARSLPGLIGSMAFLAAGALGKEAAMQSPYPVKVL